MKAGKQFFLLLFSFLLCASQAFAQNSVENIRYLAEQTAVDEITENKIIRIVRGKDSVNFYFSADEQICTEKYGKKAFEICNRNFQNALPKTDKIQITPQIKGRWAWNSDTSLVFYPQEEWQANTKYTVQIGKESLPQLTVITKPVQFTTQSLKPVIAGDFKFDPENIKTMMITGSVSFNYKAEQKNIEAKLQIIPSDSSMLSLGKMETNFHNNSLYFSIPVLKVSEKAQEVKLRLLAGLQAENGAKLASPFEYAVKIPPKNEIFKIVGCEAGIENLPDLSVKQNMIVEFSLPVSPKQFDSKKMKALLLPREKVQTEDAQDKPPYSWWSFAEITQDVLKKAEPLELTVMNKSDEESRFLMLAPKKDIEAGRSAYITFLAPIKGPDGFVIQENTACLVQFQALQGTIKIMQKGSLLSLHGDKKLSLYARGADKIHYVVRQIRPEFINSYIPLLRQAGYDQVYGYQLDPLSIVHEGDLPLVFSNAEKAQFSSLDFAPFVKEDKGFFHVTVAAQKGDVFVAEDSRFLMLSDLGLIVKADDAEEHVKAYCISLPTGKPVGGATVEVLGANGIALFSGKTDRNGTISLPPLKGYEREKLVTALTASYKDDMAVLPYADYEFALRPLNKINTAGKIFAEDSLNGFIFTQRDIYRAGETACFGFILKQGNAKNTLENVPLTGTIYASSGQLISKQKITLTKQGMGEFSCKLPDNAVSGTYNFHIEKADNSALLVSKDFYVMDFTPDTIKAQLSNSLKTKKLWYSKKELQDTVYTVSVQNLFGAPAINNAVLAKCIASPLHFHFDKEYGAYKFYDAGKADKTNVQELGKVVTDESGKAQIKLDESVVGALGEESLALTVQAEVMDAQGGSSVIVKDVLNVSPLTAVVGYKTQSNLDFLTQNEKANLEVIALDALAKPHAVGELTAELYESEMVKSLVKVDGKYQYTKIRRDKFLSKSSVNLDATVLNYSLDTANVGEKLLVLKDKKDRTVLQVRYTVVGDSTVQFNEYKPAMLQAIIDTKEYKTGENIKVALKTPYEGTGLITLERDRVFAEKWFRADKGDSVQYIEIPKDLEGKAYLNVLYFRNIEDKEIFVEPCASVVLPFTVDVSKRKLDIEVTAGNGGNGEKDFVARPGQDFIVNVKTEEPAKVLVYAVDEGITQLTGYTCPDPLKELFLNYGLSVQTYQYLDMLMPEFSLMQKEIAKFGGGERGMLMAKMANAMMDAGANPFKVRNHKSAVFWSGLLDVDKKGTEVKIPVPDTYNGNMRIFAVACSDTKVNAVQKDVFCQAEVVIQPHVPFFVSPGDEFEATLLLTDMRGEKSQKNMELAVDLGNAFEIIGDKTLAVTLEEKKQNRVDVRLKVKDTEDVLGEKTLNFTVQEKKSGLTVSMPVSISVRPASALFSSVELGRLPENNAEKTVIELSRTLYPQFAGLTASVSSAPIPYVQALLQRNSWFCYPSTMQKAAKVMPLLYLLEHKEYAPALEAYEEDAIRDTILECLQMLEKRYTYREVFYRFDNYGPMSTYELAFVLDFLTTAKEKGIGVPSYLFENVLNSMQRRLVQMPQNLGDARAVAYGAWGLTRNGIITSQIMANLTSWLEQNAKGWESDIVASLMAGSMKLMMQDELADMFIEKYSPQSLKEETHYFAFDGLCERALYTEIIAKHFADKLESEKTQQVMQELYSLLQEYFAPGSEALAARAIIEYGITQDVQKAAAKIAFVDDKGEQIAKDVVEQKDDVSHSIKLENSAQIPNVKMVQFEADKPLFYQVSVSGYDKDRFAGKDEQSFSITREFRDVDGYPVKDFRLGKEIVVVIKAKSLTGKAEKVLITDILPAAFEFVTTKAGQAASFRTMQGKPNTDVLQEETDMQVEFAGREEDRAFLLATLENRETVFRYKVRVGTKGNFVLPDITAQSVENALLYARDLTIKDIRIVVE